MRAHDGGLAGAGDLVNEALIDLDGVDGELVEVGQRGITGAEVVQKRTRTPASRNIERLPAARSTSLMSAVSVSSIWIRAGDKFVRSAARVRQRSGAGTGGPRGSPIKHRPAQRRSLQAWRVIQSPRVEDAVPRSANPQPRRARPGHVRGCSSAREPSKPRTPPVFAAMYSADRRKRNRSGMQRPSGPLSSERGG